LCQTTGMGFNLTAVKSAVKELGSGGGGAPESPDQVERQLRHAASESFEQFFRQPTAVLCGSYERGIPSLVRTYETMSAAGMRVLSPSGLDFVVEIDGLVPNVDESGTDLKPLSGSLSTASGPRIWSGSTLQMVTSASTEPWKLASPTLPGCRSTPKRGPATLPCARS
jgi:hypothetical protein